MTSLFRRLKLSGFYLLALTLVGMFHSMPSFAKGGGDEIYEAYRSSELNLILYVLDNKVVRFSPMDGDIHKLYLVKETSDLPYSFEVHPDGYVLLTSAGIRQPYVFGHYPRLTFRYTSFNSFTKYYTRTVDFKTKYEKHSLGLEYFLKERFMKISCKGMSVRKQKKIALR